MCQDVFCHAPSVHTIGHPQKKGLSPTQLLKRIKHVKSVSCVDPCLFAPNVQNVPSVVTDLPVGGRLQEFWQVWKELGANPQVVSILKEGYILPFKMKPPLTRSPMIRSGYGNPTNNHFLKEELTSLKEKFVVETVVVWSSLAFYNCLFSPQTKQQMETHSRSKSVELVPQH